MSDRFADNQREAVARLAREEEQATTLVAELEWCRLAGFSRTEWQRLRFARWLYHQGRLTEFPEGNSAVPVGVLTTWQDE